MIQGFHECLAHLLQEGQEGRVAGQVRSQRDGIGEEADDASKLRFASTVGGGADQQVILSAVAVEQDLEGSQ